ncbi:MAG: iron ABC transporter substrate-binding protein [Angelakisella sp.]
MKKLIALLLSAVMVLSFAACSNAAAPSGASGEASSSESVSSLPETRMITDGAGRKVEIPQTVESIVCVNVGALRYTTYMQAQDLVVGVEDYEQKPTMSRLYNYVNFDAFSKLPVIGKNGEHYPEAIVAADPDVIIMAAFDDNDADALQQKTGIPVVVVPSSDTTMDDRAYETFRIMGEVYGKQDRANELIAYMDSVKADLDARTKDVGEENKPTVYVGGVSFKGAHGFEGTEANYGPFEIIHAKNLANQTGQSGAFDIDLEQVLAWDPDVIFLDFNGMDLIKKDYATNAAYYNSLSAVQQGKVYSQISFRSSASNLETALADAYYAATILYPQQFADIDPEKKAGEIFEMLLGANPYSDLKEAGYEFRAIQIGE